MYITHLFSDLYDINIDGIQITQGIVGGVDIKDVNMTRILSSVKIITIDGGEGSFNGFLVSNDENIEPITFDLNYSLGDTLILKESSLHFTFIF